MEQYYTFISEEECVVFTANVPDCENFILRNQAIPAYVLRAYGFQAVVINGVTLERAIRVLLKNNYDVRNSLMEIRQSEIDGNNAASIKTEMDEVIAKWTRQDEVLFHFGYAQYGPDFNTIKDIYLPEKQVQDLTEYYGVFVDTERFNDIVKQVEEIQNAPLACDEFEFPDDEEMEDLQDSPTSRGG